MNYISAKMTRLPIIGRLFYQVMRPLFTGKNFNITYIPINRDIRGVGSTFLPERVLEELIRRSSYRATINRCTCRETEKCKNHPVENACLHLGEGARYLDRHIATPRTVEEAIGHVRMMIGRGLIPMLGRVRMDDFFYGTPNTGRSLTICFCCPCCCVLFKSVRYIPAEAQDSLVRLKGLRIIVDGSKCLRCGTCVETCFMGALSIQNSRIARDETLCKGCGMCANACPHDAVAMEVDDIEEAVGEIMWRIRQRIHIE